ncbi:fimbrial protein [Burkholderia ambifaria]|uniref:fimbrial protein n=1 Tax=Burkholderia ambifaria TaxID=152480 RepID=UPI001FC7D277|nr:fimbrial protein [Burkholderia ambifaria]WDR88023.1 fimbrial protein [Burkholderia ambifaria]WDS00752.1 fimbrial protein [Burkholderia ambifaria]
MKIFASGFAKLVITALFLGSGMSTAARAACTNSYSKEGANYFAAKVSGMSIPQFNPGSIPIGGVIASTTGNALINEGSYAKTSCDPIVNSYLVGVGLPNANGVYPTSIPNIGVRITYFGKSAPSQIGTLTGFNAWSLNVPVTIELIKLGEITAGGALSGSFAQIRAGDTAGQLIIDFRFASPVVVRPQVPTCKVATPEVTVPLGKVTTTSFNGIGTTTYPHGFEISLACSGGAAGTSTNAHITLTDATQSANTSTALSLTKESTASGVGIRILRDGKPLGFGPDSSAVGNTNQWHAGTIEQGQASLRIPLTASYVQTGAKVGAGTANARATFTLSYQ